MTDDEINRKVAEIEGWKYQTHSPDWSIWWCKFVDDGNGWYTRPEEPDRWRCAACYGEYPAPYATDWTWCGPLVEKYLVCMTHRGERWYACVYDGPDANDGDPKRAICLAVIAAHDKTSITSVTWAGLGDK